MARELYAAILADRRRGAEAAGDPDGPGSFERGRFLESLDPETRALALGLYALERPDPRNLPSQRVIYNVDKCLLTLEADRLEEQSAWNQAEQAEAELREDHEAMASPPDRRTTDQRGAPVARSQDRADASPHPTDPDRRLRRRPGRPVA